MKVKPSAAAVALARVELGMLNSSPSQLTKKACEILGLRKASDYPHSPTRLLLQASHMRTTGT